MVISPCTEPWMYWWHLLPKEKKIALKQKFFPNSYPALMTHLSEKEIKTIWEQEKPGALDDDDWMELAANYQRYPLGRDGTREVWRQVYRIASKRI
jgi:hypothetical protein